VILQTSRIQTYFLLFGSRYHPKNYSSFACLGFPEGPRLADCDRTAGIAAIQFVLLVDFDACIVEQRYVGSSSFVVVADVFEYTAAAMVA